MEVELRDTIDNIFEMDEKLEWSLSRDHNPIINHVRQCKYWDCGLACVQMVTHLYGDVQTFQDVSDLCNNVTSIWTIHLSSALLQLNIPHCITTTCAGVNQDLESLSFYVDHIENEKQEVMSLFENSIKAGTQIIESGYSAINFRALLLTRRVILILLVDTRGLRCSECGCSKRNWLTCGFTGHYLVVSSYDEEKESFVYHDPASRARTCWMTIKQFDQCRLVKGTDEDVVIIPY